MKNNKFRLSIHSPEHQALRNFWISQRQSLGLSQRDLAAKLGVTRSLVGKIETGDRRLDTLESLRYANALNINMKEFMGFLQLLME